MRSRLALVAAAIAAVSCTQGPSPATRARAAASVTPHQVPCGENDCSWIEQSGACDIYASYYLGMSGTFADVRVQWPVVGDGASLAQNRVTADGQDYWIALSENQYEFAWWATRPVDFVVALGYWEANVYRYDPANVTSDSGLVTPWDVPLTQVLFCVAPPAPPAGSLSASATASAGFTRAWQWRIEKSSPTATVTAAVGATVDVSYAVSVVATPVDSGWTAGGTLVVSNPSEVDVGGVSIEASYAGAPVVPTCPTALPLAVPAGGSVTCTWAAAESAPVDGTFVATVSSPEIAGTAGASATAAFGAPTAEPDGCVTVTDSLVGFLGTVCATASLAEGAAVAPARFAYVHAAGPYETCDATNTAYSVSNTASFTAPSGACGSSTFVVGVKVPCTQAGCTLTQGYWKTHSREGPAPYDKRWRNVGPQEEDTPFFGSGQTWIEVFRTPVRGSAYYALAHQYMAASLNVLAGASADALGDALDAARAFLAASTPATCLSAAERARVLGLADLLDRFNSGKIGPGHCGDAEAGGGCKGDDDGDRPEDRCHEGHDGHDHEGCRKHDSDDKAHHRCGDPKKHESCREHDRDDHRKSETCGKHG